MTDPSCDSIPGPLIAVVRRYLYYVGREPGRECFAPVADDAATTMKIPIIARQRGFENGATACPKRFRKPTGTINTRTTTGRAKRPQEISNHSISNTKFRRPSITRN